MADDFQFGVPVPRGQTWKTTIVVDYDATAGAWPNGGARPTASTSVVVIWRTTVPSAADASGALMNVDERRDIG